MFSITQKLVGTLARTGRITTPHGVIETPNFTAAATKATVKALTPEQVKALGAQAVLANTYHLYLQPGADLIREAGGLHKFMGWDGPIFTDSGGFQVFSLGAAIGRTVSKIAKTPSPGQERVGVRWAEKGEVVMEDAPPLMHIDDDGVSFKSHIDGSLHRFTPEKSIQIQHALGADIIFAFDECTSPHASDAYQRLGLTRTHAWAERSLLEHKKLTLFGSLAPKQELWGIVQGGRSEELRKESAHIIGTMGLARMADGSLTGGFDGFGIGGSFDKEDMGAAVRWVTEILPEDRPRHLLGIGEPLDILSAVENGVDMFDCVSPTRWGRNGTIITRNGRISIENAQYRRDFSPIEPDCDCCTCVNSSRAYVHHLFRAKEMLAATLATIHNLRFMMRLMHDIRTTINNGSFQTFRTQFDSTYK